jgi:dihydropteroate synthase-like protein
MPSEKIHFVTGRLAANALRQMLETLSPQVGFDYSIQILPITVAALLTPKWIAPRLEIPSDATKLMVPGYCDTSLEPIRKVTSLPIEVGPKDLRQLPEFFGQKRDTEGFGEYNIEIIAEINHAPRLDLTSILTLANELKNDGADIIDVGCEPNSFWPDVGQVVRALVDAGHRVSIDSLNPDEIEPAVRAGAELVLSVNSSNREAAPDWGCEVVVIPDDIRDIGSMQATIEQLAANNVPLRIDPILEPIGFGFAASLNRYWETRKRWPDAEMMMGIGNLTELTDVDSAGINVLLLAICEELGIHSVLTTQVINWARSAVRECHLARQLVHYSIREGVPPKHLMPNLVMLRDPKLYDYGPAELEQLGKQIKDHNYRIIAEAGQIHLLGSQSHFASRDPFEVFDQLAATEPSNLSASHAFYLGYEMCKAMIASQLGKQYTQDEALNWGFLTQSETDRHRLKRGRQPKQK